jgi:hypothetical protein
MHNRRDFDQSTFNGAPTMAPAAGQQQEEWPQPAPSGEPGPFPPYGQQPQDMYYGQQFGQPAPAYGAQQAALAVHRRPVPRPSSAPTPTQSVIAQQKKIPDMNPGDPENPTPDNLLCHLNPPGRTGDQKPPAQPAP